MSMSSDQARTVVVKTDETEKKAFDWGTTAWCINRQAGNSETLTFGKVVIKAGQANAKHRHGNCDEILYLLSGELDHYADDMGSARMSPGDAIVIATGVAHYAKCLGTEDAEMIVIYSSPEREIEVVHS